MKLYSYWRSSAAYRVRIALNLKSIVHEIIPVHLVANGGEQRSETYLAMNPQGLVPTLELPDGSVITQSVAIIEYLEEAYPDPPLLPVDALARARVRAVVEAICCDIHPLNNLRVLTYLKNVLGHDQAETSTWYAHWLRHGGFLAVEKLLASNNNSAPWAFGEKPGLADAVIIPQIYNARRFDVDISDCPLLERIELAAREHPAFVAALPENQPDAE